MAAFIHAPVKDSDTFRLEGKSLAIESYADIGFLPLGLLLKAFMAYY